ncbi:helix-turn-helix domain-containing protein [Odoribacter sp. OttesenSCG-928-J03]|nr:helix-turn-helix domain-containing protein [Odoribacter sp. OttesenSCG-928-J03]
MFTQRVPYNHIVKLKRMKIENEIAYTATMARIEELLPLVDDNTPLDDKNLIELDLLSGLVEEYEDIHYQIKTPSLIEVLKLRMYEMGLNQTSLAQLLGVSKSRISDYLTGKSEPTLKVAREINKKLNIDSDIVLGL